MAQGYTLLPNPLRDRNGAIARAQLFLAVRSRRAVAVAVCVVLTLLSLWVLGGREQWYLVLQDVYSGGSPRLEAAEARMARYEAMVRSVVVDTQAAALSLKEQLVDDEDYLFSLAFGGQANQFMVKYNQLYMSKYTNRTAILPPYHAVHFRGAYRQTDEIFDLPLFHELTGIRAVSMSRFKEISVAENRRDSLSCWAIKHQSRGPPHLAPDADSHMWEQYNIGLEFWAPPKFPQVGLLYDFDSITAFLQNRTKQLEQVAKARAEYLPQRAPEASTETSVLDPAKNIAPFYDPINGTPPTNDPQMLCVDAIFYIREHVTHAPQPPRTPRTMPTRVKAWEEVGQYLHFVPEVRHQTDAYLKRIFGVSRVDAVPPFISVHIRRGDFASNGTYTPLKFYANSVTKLRVQLQDRLDVPLTVQERHGRPLLQHFSIPPAHYPVLFTSDEEPGSDMWNQVTGYGWKGIDHAKLRTAELLGEWFPTLIDSDILSRAQGFVGTKGSTYSRLAGWRVESWQGGIYLEASG